MPFCRRARLFVYGTLMRRDTMRSVLGTGFRIEDGGTATVRGILYDAGAYPALQLEGAESRDVPGRLLEIEPEAEALLRLDAYEGVESGLYARRRAQITCSDGSTCEAWLYTYARGTLGLRRIARWPV